MFRHCRRSPFLKDGQLIIKKISNNSSSVKKLDVDFYFDTVSPYSWPAFEVLCRYKTRWNLNINWKPIFMAGLTNTSGNPFLSSLMECPNKASYIFMDLEKRTPSFFNIPMKMKEDPFNHIGVIGSLQQQRFLTSVLQSEPEKLESVSRLIWTRSWGEDLPVHREEDLRIVAKKGGMEDNVVDDVLANMGTDKVKKALKELTEDAADLGAFGSPTMFFSQDGDNEHMFWGSDRFEMIAHVYGKQWLGPDPDMKSS